MLGTVQRSSGTPPSPKRARRTIEADLADAPERIGRRSADAEVVTRDTIILVGQVLAVNGEAPGLVLVVNATPALSSP